MGGWESANTGALVTSFASSPLPLRSGSSKGPFLNYYLNINLVHIPTPELPQVQVRTLSTERSSTLFRVTQLQVTSWDSDLTGRLQTPPASLSHCRLFTHRCYCVFSPCWVRLGAGHAAAVGSAERWMGL